MELLSLVFVFFTIVFLLAIRRPLLQAILGGLLVIIVMNRVPLGVVASSAGKVLFGWSTLSVLISLYLITLLQRLLEARGLIKLAQQDLSRLFHSRRVNAAGTALFIGLLPSAAAMLLCSEIVKDTTEDYLEPTEQAFVTSWFRHIPESTLPTYTSVLLMANISGLPMSGYIVAMILPVLVLWLLGYYPILNKLPNELPVSGETNRKEDALLLIKHIWPLFSILVLILLFNFSVVGSLAAVVLATILWFRFGFQELPKLLRSAVDKKILISTFLILVLKEMIAYIGVLELLPEFLAQLPVPAYLIFALMFFLGGLISGANGIIALAAPLAFAALPTTMPLVVLLMCMAHASSQVSPVHLCLIIAADYFDVSLGKLIWKSLPKVAIFCAVVIVYYQVLVALGF